MNEPLRFSAVIHILGVNPYVLVSAKRAAGIRRGWRRPLPVLVRINGKPDQAWRINMMPVGDGNFYLYLHGHVRKSSHTQVGDKVSVEVVFDTQYKNGPQHPMPAWFQKPLRNIPKALRAWNALPPSRQKEVVRYFSHLKSAEARRRNLERALRALSSDGERFLGRTWKNGK